MIAGYIQNIKSIVRECLASFIEAYWRLLALMLLSFTLLGLWQAYSEVSHRSTLTITESADPVLNGEASDVYASKTGATYYFPWCGALNRIKPENRVEYPNSAAAIAAGLHPAKNCKGVE